MKKYITEQFTFKISGSLIFGLIAGLFTGCGSPGSTSQGTEETRPNIIVIVADDMGFSDLGAYGGEISTPNIDALAFNGIRFNNFYNAARCVPSRGSLLTGLYPHQAGVGRMTTDQDLPGYQGTITRNAVTIAEVLQENGYQTGMTGKWHLSPTEPREKEEQLKWLAHQKDFGDFSDLETYPTARGFQKFYGTIWGVVDYFDPFSLVNGTVPVEDVPEDFYYTRAIGDTAVAYVEEFSRNGSPFFLYVAHTAPHWPLMAPEEEIAKYEELYKNGWREIRNNRYQRLIDMGILRGDIATLPEFMFPELDWENNPDKEWDARAMAVHAAMIDVLDQTVGKLAAKLEELGELENTVIFFLSDNGASSERPSEYGEGFDRAGATRDGRQVVFPVNKDVLPGSQTVHSGIGKVWSHVSNTPFRYWKGSIYEGGISSPLIVHWPQELKEKGSIRTNVAHVTDLMATFLEISGSEYPKTFKTQNIIPTPGRSMLPMIKGESSEDTQETYIWEHFGSAAFREGDWKLVRLTRKDEWELYDMSTDRTETKNLAKDHPDLVENLKSKWQQKAQELSIFPAPGQKNNKN